MNRRDALGTLPAALAAPSAATAQSAPVPKLGYLTLAPFGESPARLYPAVLTLLADRVIE
jgi:hypothetical protein